MNNEKLEAKTLRSLKVIESEPEICIAFANHESAIQRIMTTIQLELVTEENKDSIGHTIFALKQINGIFDSMILQGKAVIEKNKKNTK